MKSFAYIFFVIVSLCGCVFTTVNAQSVPKVEKINIFASIFIIKDSLFLRGLDSLIFNSVCPEIKDMNDLKIFNVYSKKNDKQTNSYELIIILDRGVQIHNENDFKGCFEYNGYLFLWFYNIPSKLFFVSDQKKKLTFLKGVPRITSSHAEFTFDYTEGKLKLTGICCY